MLRRKPVKKNINVAVLVSGGGTNLQAIIDFSAEGKLESGKIVKVISSKADVFALTRAKDAEIPTAVVERKGKTQEEFENGILEQLESCKAEVIVLAGFMSILSKNFTDKYKDRIINVHPALIPSFCGEGYYGLKVHEAALAYGVKVTGATVHYVNEIADGGEIIMQKAVKVKEKDTPETLQKRVMQEAEWKILPASLELVCKKLLKEI
ncbi:MAG: phosphoribosylglycinamide formyltransferase [Clostridiales bacterium]|nr:phosphoribosylglycinamide formyltransferase [Clostridiales bacterium]